jgi:hypothetical protein
MMTIFTVPKPFEGHIGVIQRNAVRSWLALRPECEILLFGDEPGTADCAEDLAVTHIAGIACTAYGTPMLDDAFRQTEVAGRFPLLCYVNADIILPPSFTSCTGRIMLPSFLMVGRRVDLDVTTEMDFADPACRRVLEEEVREHGVLHRPWGSDYFVFPKGALGALPPFAVGRPDWDNWMIFRARQLRRPVVDASECVLAVHQNHSYEHVPGGTGDLWEGPEADMNRDLAGESAGHFTLDNANWLLKADGLAKRHWRSRDRGAVLETAAVFHPWVRPLLPAARLLLRAWDRAVN